MENNPEYNRRAALESDRVPLHEIELIKYRDNRTGLIFKLITGEELEGAIRWYDPVAIRLVRPDRSELTLCRAAISYYRTRV